VDICYKIVRNQIHDEHIDVISVSPFFEAVRETFALGMTSKSKWLLALDADVLFFPKALDYIENVAEEHHSKDLFRIDFKVSDKFRGEVCAGAHLYLNKWSEQILAHLENDPGAGRKLRLESDNVVSFCRAKALDYHQVEPEYAVGWHDHFQYYSDIFLKYRRRYGRCLVDRNLDNVEESIKKKNTENKNDIDFRMALEGLRAERDSNNEKPEVVMRRLGITEKSALCESSQSDILDILSVILLP
jgi:hypothetical protein